MGLLGTYRLRLERKRSRARAFRKRKELEPVQDNTARIRRRDVLLFVTMRNERIRLPYFLKYYRELGIDHFLFVDNDSDDDSLQILLGERDVSVWHTDASYRRARFGIDWLNHLQAQHGHGRWCLTVDVDEFFIYPFCDTRPIRALTDWLDASSIRSFGTMMLDMYPKGGLQDETYKAGHDPFQIASWFDSGNYMISRNEQYDNLWIQGGPRARVFFADNPSRAPALNKIPLVKWDREYAYVSSTHTLLPRGLNRVYDEWGGEKTSGCLLHAKFMHTFIAKSEEELERKQHYSGSQEYRAYTAGMKDSADLWCKWSEKYINWRQLEILGLMSKGNWA